MLSRFIPRTARVPLAATQQFRRIQGQATGGWANTLGGRGLELSLDASVLTIAPNKTVQSCAELMAMARVGSFVVTDSSRKVMGIVTERDILRCLGSSYDRLTKKGMNVKDIMTPANKLIVCSHFDTRANILKTMQDSQIRHVLLQDSHQITECVSLRDLVADLIQSDKLETVLNEPRK